MTAVGPDDAILDAWLTKLGTLSFGTPALPWSWPEAGFSPPPNPANKFEAPSDKKYLEVRYLPNKPGWQSVNIGTKELLGLITIIVHWPKAVGIPAPTRIASAVIAALPRGTKIAGTGVTVSVEPAPYYTAPLSTDSELQIPVTIPWRAFVAG